MDQKTSAVPAPLEIGLTPGEKRKEARKGKRNKGKWSRVSRYPRRVPFAF